MTNSPQMPSGEAGPAETPMPETARGSTEPLRTVQIEEGPLGLVARRLGEVFGGGLVVMNGLNMYKPVGPITLENEPLGTAVQEIAKVVPCEATKTDGYYFLHPEGAVYERLNAVSLDDKLDPRYDGLRAAAVWGVDTPIFNALALLGHTLGITLIADNAVADALTGEVALSEMPLASALEALLKSARMNEQVFRVESTDEYIFFHHVNNQSARNLLLNEGELNGNQRALLERRVDVTLPRRIRDPKQVAGLPGAVALGHVLDSLSAQLGVEVRAEPGLEKLPVNPVVMNDVRVRTALNLLVRQWLLPEFAYELAGDVVIIRHVGADELAG